jgi:hypothetical protein
MVGKQTTKDLAKALIPGRLYFILVVLAIFAAIGATLLAYACERIGAPGWLSKEMNALGSTFRVMPIWFLIGGSLSQLATRLDRAITEGMKWWNDREPFHKRMESWLIVFLGVCLAIESWFIAFFGVGMAIVKTGLRNEKEPPGTDTYYSLALDEADANSYPLYNDPRWRNSQHSAHIPGNGLSA